MDMNEETDQLSNWYTEGCVVRQYVYVYVNVCVKVVSWPSFVDIESKATN